MLTGALRELLAQPTGALEQLSPLTQAGVLIGLLMVFGFAIKSLFGQMIKSKDAEITAAREQVKSAEERAQERVKSVEDTALERIKSAEERAARYEQKLDHQQEVMQHEVLSALKDASSTTRRALEITQRGSGHDN